MRGGAACLGGARVTAASGPRAAEKTRTQAGPRRSPARSLAPTRAAPQHLRPRRAGVPARSADHRNPRPANRTHPPATSTPSLGGSRDVEGARRPRQLRPAQQPQPGTRGPAAGARPGRRWGGGEAPCAPQGPMGVQQVACVGGAYPWRRDGDQRGRMGSDPCAPRWPIRVRSMR